LAQAGPPDGDPSRGTRDHLPRDAEREAEAKRHEDREKQIKEELARDLARDVIEANLPGDTPLGLSDPSWGFPGDPNAPPLGRSGPKIPDSRESLERYEKKMKEEKELHEANDRAIERRLGEAVNTDA